MMVFYNEPFVLAIVRNLLARKIIGDVCFLQAYIAVIFFIFQNSADCLNVPNRTVTGSGYVGFGKYTTDLTQRSPLISPFKYGAYNRCFFGNDFKISILTFTVAVTGTIVKRRRSVIETDTKVLTYGKALGFAFVLIKACIQSEHTNCPGIIYVQLLDFKIYINAQLVQLITSL